MYLPDFYYIKAKLKYGVKGVLWAVSAPFSRFGRKLANAFSSSSIMGRIGEDVMNEIQNIKEKPDSLKGYFAIGERYVAKKLVFVLALSVIILPLLFLKSAYPWVESRFLTKTIVINSEDMKEYTGKVRLVGDLQENNVIFVGTLTQGKINGYGTLYDSNGNLRYRGGFLEEQYSGIGESYYQNGNVEYTGQFAVNQYEGTGKLYDEAGFLIYEGEFSQGLYQGYGRLYRYGVLLYEGGFSGGLYEGKGML